MANFKINCKSYCGPTKMLHPKMICNTSYLIKIYLNTCLICLSSLYFRTVTFVGLIGLMTPGMRLKVRQLGKGLVASRVATFIWFVSRVGSYMLL